MPDVHNVQARVPRTTFLGPSNLLNKILTGKILSAKPWPFVVEGHSKAKVKNFGRESFQECVTNQRTVCVGGKVIQNKLIS